jgi:lysophospholipase L1-like esterase
MDFGEFSTSNRGEPRNQGFAFNWARSDATTDDMIATGQHTGLAAQVGRGEVKFVVIFIGGNDFIRAIRNPEPLAMINAVVPRAAANLELAITTILAAHPEVQILLLTLPDIRFLPEFREPLLADRFPRVLADAAKSAIRRYNESIRTLATQQSRVTLLDLDLIADVSELIYPAYLPIAGHPIARNNPGDDPNRLFLADTRHLGTVGQGLLASMLLSTINAKFAAGLPPLLDQEILDFALSVGPQISPTVPNPRAAWTNLSARTKGRHQFDRLVRVHSFGLSDGNSTPRRGARSMAFILSEMIAKPFLDTQKGFGRTKLPPWETSTEAKQE